MTHKVIITIEFTGYWLASTGGSGSDTADAPAYRDIAGCPAMPMSMIKGTLRETALEHGIDVTDLFGAEGMEAQLRFTGNARLPEEDRAFFAKSPAALAQLFRRLPMTAIAATGVAKSKSLRSVEACVPMTLQGIVQSDMSPCEWRNTLDRLCALTLSLGKMKTSGFGRAIMSCQESSIASEASA